MAPPAPPGCRERRRDLARGDAAPHHGALGDEFVPRHQVKAVDIEGRCGDDRSRNPRPRYEPCRIEHGRTHGTRADGGAFDEIRRQHRGPALQQRPCLAGEVGVEQRLAHRVVIDVGLDMEDHLGAGDPPTHIDPGNDVERRGRIAWRRNDIESREDIGRDLAVPVGGNRRRRAFLRPQPLGAGKYHCHHLGCEPLAQLALLGCGRRRHGERDEHEQRQRESLAQENGRPQAHSLRRPSGMMAASKFAPSVCASVRIAFFRLAPSKLTPRKSAP